MNRAHVSELTPAAGLMASVTHDSTNTVYNSESIETRGISIVPYAKFKLNDWLSLDVSFGGNYSWADQTRAPFGPPAVTGSYTSTSMFGSASLSASKWHEKWLLSGKLGVNGSQSERAAFTESDGTVNAASTSTLLQTSLGGTIGYWVQPALQFVTGEYVYDIDHPAPTVAGATDDRDEVRLTAGMQIYGQGEYDNVCGRNVTGTFLREQRNSAAASASLRVGF